jgi:hypothetical protein
MARYQRAIVAKDQEYSHLLDDRSFFADCLSLLINILIDMIIIWRPIK